MSEKAWNLPNRHSDEELITLLRESSIASDDDVHNYHAYGLQASDALTRLREAIEKHKSLTVRLSVTEDYDFELYDALKEGE